MSFSIDLTAGAIKVIYQGSQVVIAKPKPFLQVIRLQKIESDKLHSDRYKLVLSDGLAYMHAVLSPKLNSLIASKRISNFSVVKLIEYDVHPIKGKKLIVISHLEEIVLANTTLGSPVSVEKLIDPQTTTTSPASSCGDISMADAMMSQQNNEPINVMHSLATDLIHLFNNPQLSDITFILKDGNKLYAHRNILATRSAYFSSMFLNGMRESYEKELLVNAWDPEIFTTIIRFIYTDQIMFTSDTQVDRVWHLFLAAKYYNLDRLCRVCEQFLVSERLDTDTVCILWPTARELDARIVDKACYKFFEANFQEIALTDSFVHVQKDMLLQALKSEDLQVSDMEMISQAVLKWGRFQMNLPNSSITKQELFCTFFPLLRIKRKCQQTQPPPTAQSTKDYSTVTPPPPGAETPFYQNLRFTM